MKDEIQNAVQVLTGEIGAENITLETLADFAGFPSGSFTHHMGVSFKEFIEPLVAGSTFDVASIKRARALPCVRYAQLLNCAVAVAERDGLQALTLSTVSLEAGVSSGTVINNFKTVRTLRSRVIRRAMRPDDPRLKILAEALACGDDEALELSQELKCKTGQWLAER